VVPEDSVAEDTDTEDTGAEDADDEASEEEADDDPWATWANTIIQQFEEPMKDRVRELENEYLPVNAQDLVWEEYLAAMNKRLQKVLIGFLNLHHRLRKDPTYQKIVDTAKRAREEDEMDFEESVTHAVKRRKLLLDRVLEQWKPDLTEEEHEDSDWNPSEYKPTTFYSTLSFAHEAQCFH